MNAHELIQIVEAAAPPSIQAEWDNSGLQVAGSEARVGHLAVTLDPAPEAVGRCLEMGADFILTHHPLYMKPKGLDRAGPFLDTVRKLFAAGAWLYSAHTSLDAAPGGPAQWLGRELKLANTALLETTSDSAPIKVSFHVDSPLERDTAEVWAGREGVMSISQDRNQFVRIVCEPDRWPALAEAIVFHLGAKPEFFIKNYTAPRIRAGMGQVGLLPETVPAGEFIERIKKLTGRTVATLVGPVPESVRTVAYCPGSGGSLISEAFARGADVFITGDVKYHDALDAPGLVMDVGHFSLEEEMIRRFHEDLARTLYGRNITVSFVPGRDPYAFA